MYDFIIARKSYWRDGFVRIIGIISRMWRLGKSIKYEEMIEKVYGVTIHRYLALLMISKYLKKETLRS